MEAIEAVEEARAIDPQFYRAHLAAADFWLAQIVPTSRATGITGLPYGEREDRAMGALRAAEATAPDPVSRLRTELARARLELRLRDAVELARRIAELEPSGDAWLDLGIRAAAIGQYDRAREAYAEAAARAHEVRFGLVGGVAAAYHRVDPEAGLELADRWWAEESRNLDDLYQAHRVLLAGGRVEQAAEVAERYLARSTDPSGGILVRVRQLCAEGRIREAGAYVDSLAGAFSGDADDAVVLWHALSYVGRPDEAAEMLRRYDDAGELYALSNFLIYTFFDPRPFPKLTALLRRNDALREEQLPIPYQCPVAGA